jgi:hypothetical protein
MAMRCEATLSCRTAATDDVSCIKIDPADLVFCPVTVEGFGWWHQP